MTVIDTITGFAYLIAATCFVLGLHFMRSPATARRGNTLSASGMAFAILISLVLFAGHNSTVKDGWTAPAIAAVLLVAGLLIGGILGAVSARKVKMTAMPQLVSVFNAVGGGAAVVVALTDFIEKTSGAHTVGPEVAIPVALDIIIGTVTFTGSWIAAGKLQGLISGKPISFPGSRVLLFLAALGSLGFGITVMVQGTNIPFLFLSLLCAGIFGIMMTLPIGGADMPVVISLLNAFTGLAVAMAGFVMDNNALIIAGALVGASGSILTKQMADAMNRSILAIMVGGFGGGGSDDAAAAAAGGGTVRTVTADDVAIQLAYAQNVMFVPGYGLAAAQAQHEIAALSDLLVAHGINVNYAIHPVAGRMPGHMNVLLAEANVPYDQMKEMDEANEMFETTDVALVVGANDVTNPAARRPGSPLAGMPILNVDKAKSVIVNKRSMGKGYAGLENELYTDPKTGMYFGDAKKALAELTNAVKTYLD